jgi:NAD(P)-dependent dehydrogenase (short-subunit alcohol dehydrogenase family)
MRLEGKVALVTHIDSPVSAAIARRFAAEGARVSACLAAGPHARKAAADLPPDIQILDGDVHTPADANRIVQEIASRHGRLDVLVNYGAGGRIAGKIMDVSHDEFVEGMTGDVWSVMALCSAAIPLMAKGGGGSIVNLSSIARVGVKGRPLRSASQAAVSALTRSMALDHAEERVRVNALLLGPTMGPEFTSRPEQLQRLVSEAPLGELHTADDVAAAALFLASDDARMITGALLPLDAGRSLATF